MACKLEAGNEWVIDLGATEHITHKEEILKNKTKNFWVTSQKSDIFIISCISIKNEKFGPLKKKTRGSGRMHGVHMSTSSVLMQWA